MKKKFLIIAASLAVVVVILLIIGLFNLDKQSEYSVDEVATNKEVNIKVSDIKFYQDYVSLILAFENISKNGIEYSPLDFVLRSSNGDDIKYSYSSKEASSLASGGQIMWELQFEYDELNGLKLIYKKDFEDKTIIINIDYEEETNSNITGCSDETNPFDRMLCEYLKDKDILAVLDENATIEDIENLSDDISGLSGIKAVRFVSKEAIYERMVKISDSYITDNPYELYNIRYILLIEIESNIEIIDAVNQIKILDKIDSVRYGSK